MSSLNALHLAYPLRSKLSSTEEHRRRFFGRKWETVAISSGITRCIFSEKGLIRVSCSSTVREVWKTPRERVQGRRLPVSAQPSDGPSQTYNAEDYEEKEETEEEARKRNWVDRGWAPWEEILSPEAQFAVDSLAPGEEEPVVSWESFQKLNPKWQEEHRKKLEEEAERKEREKPPVSLEGSLWEEPLVFTLIPPRDWPPPGWKVDPKELAYIREAQFLENVAVDPKDLAKADREELDEERFEPEFPRWKMFLKQYNEWVAANKDRLDQEAQEIDPEYYPGRRRIGKNAETESGQPLYELPFIYPGQHYWGVVSCVSLYEGAFINFGGVHDGWVPIHDNDWFYIRDVIKVGMQVQVEVLAKRDPYRFRFPIQMRFVDPNIDDMIFRRLKYPPIFARPGDDDLDEVARDSGRPFYPKPREEKSPEDEHEPKLLVHPAIPRLWQLHQAEQMVLDEEDGGGNEDDDNVFLANYFDEEEDDDFDDEEEEVTLGIEDEETFEPQFFENGVDYEIPTLVLNTDPNELNLNAARAEREEIKRLAQEADSRGEEFKPPMLQFEQRVIELNNMHTQRRNEEAQALLRDTASRKELGLPLEEPGRYADKELWGKNPYDPTDPRWRHDYWGDPSKIKEEIRREREPRVARVDETAAVGDIEDDELGGKEEEVEEVGGSNAAEVVKKEKEDRGVVNGTATVAINDVRTMFSMQPEDYNVADKVVDVEDDVDDSDEDTAERGGIDMPDTNR